jgi:hypothetical protein
MSAFETHDPWPCGYVPAYGDDDECPEGLTETRPDYAAWYAASGETGAALPVLALPSAEQLLAGWPA